VGAQFYDEKCWMRFNRADRFSVTLMAGKATLAHDPNHFSQLLKSWQVQQYGTGVLLNFAMIVH